MRVVKDGECKSCPKYYQSTGCYSEDNGGVPLFVGTPQRDVRRRKKKHRGGREGWERRNVFPPPPLFLLIFVSLSSFAPHSTIRTPGKGYQQARSLEAACCNLVMGLKFAASTHLPCEACTITIMIKTIMIIIWKLIIIIIITILMIESFVKKWLKSLSGFH